MAFEESRPLVARLVSPGDGDGMLRAPGAGEMLACSTADFETFEEPRPRPPNTRCSTRRCRRRTHRS